MRIASAIDAVPAIWSGPRLRTASPDPAPLRPPSGRQRSAAAADPGAAALRIHDLSLVPALCWPHDGRVAQR